MIILKCLERVRLTHDGRRITLVGRLGDKGNAI
jgi:hypothetical protein